MHAVEARIPARARAGHEMSWGLVFLLLYATVSIGRIQEVFPSLAPLRIGVIFGGCALLVWLLSPGTMREKIPTKVKAVQYILMLLGLAVLTIPLGVWPGHSIQYLFGPYLKTILLFLLVIYWCRSLQDMRRLIWVCCIVTAILIVPGVMKGAAEERYSGDAVSYDPNDLALLLVIVLPLVLYLFSTSGRWAKIVLTGVALLCLYGIVLTQSRGGLLALVFVGGLILWRGQMSRSTKQVIVVCAVLVFGVLAGTAYKERIATMFNPQSEYDQTAGGRTDLWKAGLILMLRRPWGVGIDGYVTAEGLSHQGFGKWSTAHNSFLQIGVELGVVGLIIFVRLLAHVMKDLRRVETLIQPERKLTLIERARNDARLSQKSKAVIRDPSHGIFPLAETLEISLWGFVVGGFFLSQAYSGMLYILLALSLVCVRLARDTFATQGGTQDQVAWARSVGTSFQVGPGRFGRSTEPPAHGNAPSIRRS